MEMQKRHDFCERSVTVSYAAAIDPETSCCALKFKHFHYENGLIVIPLLGSTAVCTERGGGEEKKRGEEREREKRTVVAGHGKKKWFPKTHGVIPGSHHSCL